MPAPHGPKHSSPLRVGGLALVGVGVVAGILGVVGLSSSSTPPPVSAPSMSTGAAPSPSTEPAAPPSAEPTVAAPPADSAVPAPGPAPVPPPPVPPPPAPPSPAPAPPAGEGAGRAGAGAGSAAGSGSAGSGSKTDTSAHNTPVRVYNNSRISGLAAGAADDFRKAGWTVNAVDNYAESQGLIATSTVYYRPGTNEQSSAELMRNEFGLRAAPRFAGLTDASPGLIVIVTNDYQRR